MYLCFHKKMKLYRVGPEHFQKLIHSSQSLVAAIFVTSFQFTVNRCAECWVCNRCNPWPSKHSGRNNFLWWSHERKHGQLLDVTNKYKYIHFPVDDWKYSHGQCFKLTVGHRGGDIQVLGCFSYSGLRLLHRTGGSLYLKSKVRTSEIRLHIQLERPLKSAVKHTK